MALIGFVGLCLLVYVANGAVTATSVGGWYHTLARPPAAPPDWVFAPVWAALYLCIGLSAWLVWRRIDVAAHRKRAALRVWGWQLLLNALWPAAFFGAQSPGLGMLIIVPLLAAAVAAAVAFWPLQRAAAVLLLPYLGWLGFATYLNAGFWWLSDVGPWLRHAAF